MDLQGLLEEGLGCMQVVSNLIYGFAYIDAFGGKEAHAMLAPLAKRAEEVGRRLCVYEDEGDACLRYAPFACVQLMALRHEPC